MVDKKPEIPRKPKKIPTPESNGAPAAAATTNGKHSLAEEADAAANLKRPRLDDSDVATPAKKAKTSGVPPTSDGDDVVVVDESSGGGIIIVDDD